eukprot:gnl/Spiro4/18540_TR9932_c0_g1_i1.p1 gnl/Spiro4/18540_TR9932_c0_g1~~gnl/Spiro4/18540_TR9932_c0_g1_i1.p1  ORF type:complete len:910 (+),score=317.93 gnl/Spiro4/18540_TR9932_c0_g1_i1:89-2731(+)
MAQAPQQHALTRLTLEQFMEQQMVTNQEILARLDALQRPAGPRLITREASSRRLPLDRAVQAAERSSSNASSANSDGQVLVSVVQKRTVIPSSGGTFGSQPYARETALPEKISKDFSRTRVPLEVLRLLPKPELHFHLDGAVRPSTVLDLARKYNTTTTLSGHELPWDEAKLRSVMTVPLDCPSLEVYLQSFDVTLAVMQRYSNIRRIMMEACADAAAGGVRYLEVRFSPMLHTHEGLSMAQVVDAVLEGRVHAELASPIRVGVILCGMRQLPPAEVVGLAELAWRYRTRGVVGFDLAGPEAGFSSLLHQAAFRLVRSKRLNCTLHSGEAAGWLSVRDSILHCGAQRIGHGVRMEENAQLVQLAANRGVTIEVCLTSNVQTKAIRSLDSHPIRRYFDLGMMVVPCVDNMGVSNTTLAEEYEKLVDIYGFNPTEVVQLMDYGYRAAFADAEVKKVLREGMLIDTLRIYAKAGIDTAPVIRAFAPIFPRVLLSQTAAQLLTLDTIRRLPKAESGLSLVGSVPLNVVWDEIVRARQAGRCPGNVQQMASEQDLVTFVMQNKNSHEGRRMLRDLFLRLLQEEGQIKRAIAAVLQACVDDGYIYVELVVNPTKLSRTLLTREQALRTCLDAVLEAPCLAQLTAGVTVTPRVDRLGEDDAESFEDIAHTLVELAATPQYQPLLSSGILYTGNLEVAQEDRKAFDFLTDSFTPVQLHYVSSDDLETDEVVTAMQETSATKLSSAKVLCGDPELVSFLAAREVPILVSLEDEARVAPVSAFANTDDSNEAGAGIRAMMVREVRVVLFSGGVTLLPGGRCEALMAALLAANFDVMDILTVLAWGFRCASHSALMRERLSQQFWARAISILDLKQRDDIGSHCPAALVIG